MFYSLILEKWFGLCLECNLGSAINHRK